MRALVYNKFIPFQGSPTTFVYRLLIFLFPTTFSVPLNFLDTFPLILHYESFKIWSCLSRSFNITSK
jgi:hypothetical protein